MAEKVPSMMSLARGREKTYLNLGVSLSESPRSPYISRRRREQPIYVPQHTMSSHSTHSGRLHSQTYDHLCKPRLFRG